VVDVHAHTHTQREKREEMEREGGGALPGNEKSEEGPDSWPPYLKNGWICAERNWSLAIEYVTFTGSRMFHDTCNTSHFRWK
jgi:hypothetical protein